MAIVQYRKTISEGDYVRIVTFSEPYCGMIGRVFMATDGICGVRIGDEVQVFRLEELQKVYLRSS